MKPPAFQCFCGCFRPLPISGEHIWPTHQDFGIFADLHLNPRYRGPDEPRSVILRIIERADASGFREAVRLQNRNAKHHKKSLRLDSQWSGSANESLEIGSDRCANFAEEKHIAETEPQRVGRFWSATNLARECRFSSPE